MCKTQCTKCVCKVQKAKIEKASELGFLSDEEREVELAKLRRANVTSREVHSGSH